MYTLERVNELKKEIIYIKEINNYVLNNNKIDIDKKRVTKSELLDIINKNDSKEYIKFKNILDKYEKNNLKKNEYNSIYTLCLHPSRSCNLSCKYCFAEKKDNKLPVCNIKLESAKKAIDYMIYDWGKNGSRYVVDLAGSGEPLLNFELIKQIEQYCDIKRNELGKEIKIMFPTNATLINKEMAEYFKCKKDILLGVSIDGDRNQNSNRLLKNGEEAFEKTISGIKLVKDRTIGLAVTITNKNEDVDKVYDYLYNEIGNADAISMQPVREYNKDAETCFYNINIDNLMDHYKTLCQNLFEHIKKNDYEYLFTLFRGVDSFAVYTQRVINKGMLTIHRCGAGKCHIAIDDKEKIYICGVENGNDFFKIGDLTNGINKELQSKFLKSNIEESLKCRDCWAANICGGECFITSYLTNGDLYSPNDKLCEFKKRLIKIAISFAEALNRDYPEGYKVLKRYIQTKPLFESISDSGYWAINNYFHLIGNDILYSTIKDEIKTTDRGILPNVLQEYIEKKIGEINAVKITNTSYFNDINYPAIAFMNKSKGIFYTYVILTKKESNYLFVKVLESDEDIKIPEEEFLDKCSSIIFYK